MENDEADNAEAALLGTEIVQTKPWSCSHAGSILARLRIEERPRWVMNLGYQHSQNDDNLAENCNFVVTHHCTQEMWLCSWVYATVEYDPQEIRSAY